MEEIFVKSRNILKSYMKNLNMLFNNKLPTDLYTTFQIIKLLIGKRNLNLIHNKNTYQHYISNFIKASTTYISKSIYTRNFLHMKWKANTAQWGVSIKLNNENEKYTLHFIFHTKILHIKSSRIPVMETMST